MEAREVTEHLLRRSRWGSSRSSGPGGQRRDKVETRAELTIEMESLEGLEAWVAARLATWLQLEERPLRLTSQDDRSLARNQERVVARLQELVSAALAPPAPPRRATRPSRGQRRARVDDKVLRGRVKRLRQQPPSSE